MGFDVGRIDGSIDYRRVAGGLAQVNVGSWILRLNGGVPVRRFGQVGMVVFWSVEL
jgi:hypothetical protein